MDDKIKIKDLNPISQNDFKESAEFPITQDGETYKASISQVIQKVSDNQDDKYFKKTEKIPNDNLTFGKVKEGDKNVISGGDVYKKTNTLQMYKNFQNAIWTDIYIDKVRIADGNEKHFVLLPLIDSCIKNIALLSNTEREVYVNFLSVKKTATNLVVNFKFFTKCNNKSELLIVTSTLPLNKTKFHLSNDTCLDVIELVCDFSSLDTDKEYAFYFSDNLKEDDNRVKNVTIESLSCFNEIPNVLDTKKIGARLALVRAIKDIRLYPKKDTILDFDRINKTATSYVIDFYTQSMSDGGILSKTSPSVVLYRATVSNADAVGLQQLELRKVSSKPDQNNVVNVLFDFEALKNTIVENIYTIDKKPKTTAIINNAYISYDLADRYDFKTYRYCDYRGLWYSNNQYIALEYALKIPHGAKKIYIGGKLDKNANAIFGDAKMMALEWAVKNEDGTKYSGESVFENGFYDIPKGARYVHVSILNSSISNAKIYVLGNIIENDAVVSNFKEINLIGEALSDIKFKGIFNAGNYVLSKDKVKEFNVNNIRNITNNDVTRAETMSHSEVIFEIHEGVNIGQLCDVSKDGYMYFYNGNVKCIYKQNEENNTIELVTDVSTHPNVWSDAITTMQQRTNVICLNDGSILFTVFKQGNSLTTTENAEYYQLYKIKDNIVTECFRFSNESYVLDGVGYSANGCLVGDWSYHVENEMILITEYGQGTSKYWREQDNVNNARGVSSKAWVSFDNGNTWKKFFDLARKKSGSSEADNNWYYFTSKLYKEFAHIHCVKYDSYRKKVIITNGDGETYIWTIDLEDLKNWYQNAPVAPSNTFPIYSENDTFPTTYFVNLNSPSVNTFNIGYNAMRYQMVTVFAIENGWIWGHDMSREFAYLTHAKDINNKTYVLEPVFNFENRLDFDTEWEFLGSQTTTDGFVMSMVRKDSYSPILISHSASGKYGRIWATYDGVSYKEVLKTKNKGVITFGSKILFGKKGIYVSTGASVNSNNSGYYKIND